MDLLVAISINRNVLYSHLPFNEGLLCTGIALGAGDSTITNTHSPPGVHYLSVKTLKAQYDRDQWNFL